MARQHEVPPCRNRSPTSCNPCPPHSSCLKTTCPPPRESKPPSTLCSTCTVYPPSAPCPSCPAHKASPCPPHCQTPPCRAKAPCSGPLGLPPGQVRRRRTADDVSSQHLCSTSSTQVTSARQCPSHGVDKVHTHSARYTHTYKRTASPDGFSSGSSYRNHALVGAPGCVAGGRQGGVVLALGGVDPFNTCMEVPARLVQQFQPQSNSWSLLTKLPDARHHHGVAVLDGFVYVVGGSHLDAADPGNLANPTAVCYRYSRQENAWARVAGMARRRAYHGLTVLGGLLYAVGGQDQDGATLDSVEYYNPDTDCWQEVSAMTEPKIGCATIGHHGYLYAVGGYVETADEKTILGTVECYDPHTNTWFSRRHLPGPRCHASVVEAEGRLFLLGGATFYDDTDAVTSLTSVLAYNESDDHWDHFLTLRTPRHDFGCATLGSRIYIVGGVCSSQNRALCDVECIDVAGCEWVDQMECLGNQALGIACCALQLDL